MRWKRRLILLFGVLCLGGVFVGAALRSEWFFHVVARKEFLYPPDAPRPYRLIAEIRRQYPVHDWRSLLRQSPGVYMQYECRIRDTQFDWILTSSFWVFADHPQPSVYSISPSANDKEGQVVFNLDGEVVRCRFDVGGHFCWVNEGEPAFVRPWERN